MSKFQLPQLPASCFGICVSTFEDDFDGRIEKFDGEIIWFKDKKKERKTVSVAGNYRRSELADTLKPHVSTAAPGSKERIAALQAFYADHMPEYDSHQRAILNGKIIDDSTCVSPFSQTIEEMADALIAKADAINRKMNGDTKVYSKSRKPMNTKNMD
jgi:hypothetical protein